MLSISLCSSIIAALLLINSYSQHESTNRYVFGYVVSLILSAAALSLLPRLPPSLSRDEQLSKGRYETIPLGGIRGDVTVQENAHSTTLKSRLKPRQHFFLIFVAAVILVLRIELQRKISETAQCAGRSWAVFLPFLLAINECRFQQRAEPSSIQEEDGTKSSAHVTTIRSYILQSTWRYVPPALILSYGCYSMTALWQGTESTVICPIASGQVYLVPKLQHFATIFDCALAIIAQEIARSNNVIHHRLLSVSTSYALAFIGAALCWTTYAVILFLLNEDMEWSLVNDTPSNTWLVILMLGQGLLVGSFVLSSTYCVFYHGIYQTSMILTAAVTIYLGSTTLWASSKAFPAIASSMPILPFLIIYLGLWSSYRIGQISGQIQQSRTSTWQILTFVLFLCLLLPGFWINNDIQIHPIDTLMLNAKTQHELYNRLASQSTDLQTAVAFYQERYQTSPPPGFDKWYEYARNRSVVVVDEYDQIHRDLLPFRALRPSELRRQTWEEISNPWNEIAGISIRNGKAEVAENVLPTHRWMPEGVAILINSFAQYLPDMDLAFNLNDESRVAVPYDRISYLREQAVHNKLVGKSNWSSNRASTWKDVPNEPFEETIFENFSFQKNFRRFGTVGCPPSSLARTYPYLSSQSRLCFQCLEPHSVGQFVSNWTLSADMCHQPDMSHLHGFYLSPAAYKTSHQLTPVFSQSKASGYNDILYPSAWNYMDKAVYSPTKESGEYGTDNYSPGYPDPPFPQKSNILYWRGATSEGVSGGSHAWRGMTRQRLVHLANNSTSDAEHDQFTILLPNLHRQEQFTYYPFSGSALTSLGLQQNTNIKITDHIARCGGIDCPDQENEFDLVHPVDFQSHWKYKFLFDMDGAAFSGRFLPFLQSHSLPFKTALFREWYDSRLTAWRHFVPIDLRLHGVWSTLAYFAGIDGVWPGTNQKYRWEAHISEAETIAEEGREWAGKVLRKEDMEVYFFRLLLEWGRLTDDNRDELGFALSD